MYCLFCFLSLFFCSLFFFLLDYQLSFVFFIKKNLKQKTKKTIQCVSRWLFKLCSLGCLLPIQLEPQHPLPPPKGSCLPLLIASYLRHLTMVTTRSRRPSSPAAPDHSLSRFVHRRSTVDPSSVVTLDASLSWPSSSRCSHSSTNSRASPHPPISHFVSPACSHRYTTVVCHCHMLIE